MELVPPAAADAVEQTAAQQDAAAMEDCEGKEAKPTIADLEMVVAGAADPGVVRSANTAAAAFAVPLDMAKFAADAISAAKNIGGAVVQSVADAAAVWGPDVNATDMELVPPAAADAVEQTAAQLDAAAMEECEGKEAKPTISDLEMVVAGAADPGVVCSANTAAFAVALDTAKFAADAISAAKNIKGTTKNIGCANTTAAKIDDATMEECEGSKMEPILAALKKVDASAANQSAPLDLKAVAIAAAKAANSAAASAKILATASDVAAAVFKALVLADAAALAAAEDDAREGRVAIRQTLAMAKGFALAVGDAVRKYQDLHDKIMRLGAYDCKFLCLAADTKKYILSHDRDLSTFLDNDRCVQHFLWGMPLHCDDMAPTQELSRSEKEGESDKDNSPFAAVGLTTVAIPALKIANRAAASARILAAASATATAVFEILVLADVSASAAAEDAAVDGRVAMPHTLAMAKEFALDVHNASSKCQDFQDEIERLGGFEGEFLLLAAHEIFGLCPEVFPLVVCEERDRCISHFLWGDAYEFVIPANDILIPSADMEHVVEVLIPAADEFVIPAADEEMVIPSADAEHVVEVLIPAADEFVIPAADDEIVIPAAGDEQVVDEVPWKKNEYTETMAAFMNEYDDRPAWLTSDVRRRLIKRMPEGEVKRRRFERIAAEL